MPFLYYHHPHAQPSDLYPEEQGCEGGSVESTWERHRLSVRGGSKTIVCDITHNLNPPLRDTSDSPQGPRTIPLGIWKWEESLAVISRLVYKVLVQERRG